MLIGSSFQDLLPATSHGTEDQTQEIGNHFMLSLAKVDGSNSRHPGIGRTYFFYSRETDKATFVIDCEAQTRGGRPWAENEMRLVRAYPEIDDFCKRESFVLQRSTPPAILIRETLTVSQTP